MQARHVRKQHLCLKTCHYDFVVVDAINQDCLAFYALLHETYLLIEGCSCRICCEHSQLDALKSEHFCREHCVPQKSFTKPSTSPLRHNAHKEVADMSGNRTISGWYVAPSNNRVFRNGNNLRVSVFYIALYEGSHLLTRWRLQESEVPVLSGHRVNGSAKTLCVAHADLAQLDFHRVTSPHTDAAAELKLGGSWPAIPSNVVLADFSCAGIPG